MLNKVIKETNATGRQQVDMCMTECINAMNELTRHGGFAPVQWVLAKFPRQPATMGDEAECHDIGAIQAHVDGPTEFALQARYRLAAREAFIKWDCVETTVAGREAQARKAKSEKLRREKKEKELADMLGAGYSLT